MINPVPISKHTWERIQKDPEFKEENIYFVAGVEIHIVTCSLFKDLSTFVPVYIQPEWKENEKI